MVIDLFIGTSGWSYEWNKEGSIGWYVKNSGLNAIELNASFYRFPAREHVIRWARSGGSLRWSIKVHKSVTHHHMFDDHALGVFERFREVFTPLEDLTDYYLFQMPPSMKDFQRVSWFFEQLPPSGKYALEIRNPALLLDDTACRLLQEHAVLVSVDSPDFKSRIFPGPVCYMRMHGRTWWYHHDYSEAELVSVLNEMEAAGTGKIYIYIF
jgi:uncharacterized protein YecE (DUF72 family)